MNKRQIKKLFKQLCHKSGVSISETYNDGRMTKNETKKVKQSLYNIKTVMRVASCIKRTGSSHMYNFRTESEYEQRLNQYLFKQQSGGTSLLAEPHSINILSIQRANNPPNVFSMNITPLVTDKDQIIYQWEGEHKNCK